MIPPNCVSKSSVSKIKIADAKSTKSVFDNPTGDTYHLVRFDGCVLKNATACDWVVLKPQIAALAVELKGGDVDHAVEQIVASIEFMKKAGMKLSFAGLIVCSRYPRVDTKIQRLKQKLAKVHKAPLHVTTNGRELVFDNLIRFA